VPVSEAADACDAARAIKHDSEYPTAAAFASMPKHISLWARKGAARALSTTMASASVMVLRRCATMMVGAQGLERCLDALLGERVQRTSRLVQQQHARVLQDRARARHALLLACARQPQ